MQGEGDTASFGEEQGIVRLGRAGDNKYHFEKY